METSVDLAVVQTMIREGQTPKVTAEEAAAGSNHSWKVWDEEVPEQQGEPQP